MKALGLLLALVSSALSAETQFGTNNYVEYRPGTLPLVISVPHGGSLKPEGMPSRTLGRVVQDANTADLAERISRVCKDKLGGTPYLVFCHLHRSKMDANREIKEAAQGNPKAEQAWREFQAFVQQAIQQARQDKPQALYIDLHGHSHVEMLVELGYLLGHSQLRGLEESMATTSSLKAIDKSSKESFTDLVRGPQSLGALLAAKGFATLPSPNHPAPKNEQEYFQGGYNVATHSKTEGITAFQIEAPRVGVRDSAPNRQRFAEALLECLPTWWQHHTGTPLSE
jgi:hypothetical protein